MFVDTNILVKSRIQEAPDHDAARTALDRAFRDAEPLRISRQILREYLAVVTRPPDVGSRYYTRGGPGRRGKAGWRLRDA